MGKFHQSLLLFQFYTGTPKKTLTNVSITFSHGVSRVMSDWPHGKGGETLPPSSTLHHLCPKYIRTHGN